MRRPARPALTLLLILALAGCGEETEPPATAADGPSPTVATSSAVPGTRPSPTAPSTTQVQEASPAAQESLTPTASPVPTPISTESIAATPETLAGYQALATGLTALFAKVDELEQEDPDVVPDSVDELNRLVGDVFPDGVDLVVFSLREDALILCLTGPAATFLLVGPHGDTIRLVLGPGDCGDTEGIDAEVDGDVVVDLTFEIVGDGSTVRYVATVAKGQNLAAQIPGIDDLIDLLNAAIAP